jgi:predicted nuclease with TOPRIM domain
MTLIEKIKKLESEKAELVNHVNHYRSRNEDLNKEKRAQDRTIDGLTDDVIELEEILHEVQKRIYVMCDTPLSQLMKMKFHCDECESKEEAEIEVNRPEYPICEGCGAIGTYKTDGADGIEEEEEEAVFICWDCGPSLTAEFPGESPPFPVCMACGSGGYYS